MNAAALLTLLITLMQDLPEMVAVIRQDIADLNAGTLTPDQVQARWTAMQAGWAAAKAKWEAATTSAA